MDAIRQKLTAWLSGRPGLRSVLANSGWLMLERLVRMALALVVGSWVARHLGPGQYGALAHVVVLVAVWQVVASLGLESIVIRDLAHESAKAGVVLGTAFCLRLIVALLCWLGALASVSVLVPDDDDALVIALILGGGLVFQLADLVEQWFQSRTQSRYAVAPRLTAAIAASLAKVVMILVDAPLWGFALALLCDAVLAAAMLVWVYRRQGGAPTGWTFDRNWAARLLREAWPLLLAGLSVVLYMRIDLLILRNLSGETQAGFYAAVIPLSSAFHMIPMTVCASVMPRLSMLRTANPALYASRMQQLFTVMAWSGIAVAALLALAAPWIVRLLLGPAFDAAVPVLQWHALTNVFVFLGVAQSVAIVSDHTPRHALYRTLFGMIVSVCANCLLVPQWGGVGAAWAAIISYFSAAVLSNIVLSPNYLRMQVRAVWPFHAE